MKRTLLIIGLSVATLGGGFTASVSPAGANGSAAKPTTSSSRSRFAKPAHESQLKAASFALYHFGDATVQCVTTPHGRFTVSMSLRPKGADVDAAVGFGRDDMVDYTIPRGTSFSLQQTATVTPGVADLVIVAEEGDGSLVGWVSAERVPGTLGRVSCFSTSA